MRDHAAIYLGTLITLTCVGGCHANDSGDSGVNDRTGIVVNGTTDCPHVDLGKSEPVTYNGDTTGLPNHVTSSRLEWTDAPNDSLLFTAPMAGDYEITLEALNPALGASAEDHAGRPSGNEPIFFTAATCPAGGGTTEIDGVANYDGANPPLPLHEDQTILIWIGMPYYATETESEYTITVERQ